MPDPTVQEKAQAARAELSEIVERSAGTLTPEDQDRFDELEADVKKYDVEIKRIEHRAAILDEIRNNTGRYELSPGHDGGAPAIHKRTDPFEGDVRSMTRTERRDNALRVIEGAGHLAANQADHVAGLLDRNDFDEGGTEVCDGDKIATSILVTESADYKRALAKVLLDRQYELLDQERLALAKQRYQSLTNASGGFAVPALVDPTVIITSGAADAPVLSVARIETITNDVWRGISGAPPTWSWDAEGSQVSDDSVTFAQPSVTAYTGRAFLPFSLEIEGDYPAFIREMQRLLAQGYTDLIASATVIGTGSAQPWGVFIAGTQHATSTEVTSVTNGEINAVDVRNVWADLPERYRTRATWLMDVSTENQIRAFGNGNQISDFSVDMTDAGVTLINGKRVLKSDYAPSFSSTTSAQTEHLVVGDFSNFVIANRAGMRVERVDHLMGANQRPTGQRGAFAWARFGSDIVNDSAFRVLINASV